MISIKNLKKRKDII